MSAGKQEQCGDETYLLVIFTNCIGAIFEITARGLARRHYLFQWDSRAN